MLRKENGNVYAVLNDLDLAVDADVQRQSSKHRTGTKPFMAIDLLGGEPTVHMYRHDLESLFSVLLCMFLMHISDASRVLRKELAGSLASIIF